jgi:hypothetical protein
VGTWQLISQTSCMENELEEDDDTDELVADMKSRSGGTSSVIEFKDNNMGSESIKMIETRKSSKSSNFMYKVDGDILYLLDKKSHLLIGSYDIERLTTDSLIFSNAKRACETRIFAKISSK